VLAAACLSVTETRQQEVDSSRLQHDHAGDVHHLETRGRVLAAVDERLLTATTQLVPDAESIKLQVGCLVMTGNGLHACMLYPVCRALFITV
jgi:hypothetical protein